MVAGVSVSVIPVSHQDALQPVLVCGALPPPYRGEPRPIPPVSPLLQNPGGATASDVIISSLTTFVNLCVLHECDWAF